MQEHVPVPNVERAAALDLLLLLADSHADAQGFGRALRLLGHAERAAGGLPPEYEMKRLRWLVRI